MTKLWLEEGFCPVDRYQCLMPIEYVPLEKEGAVQSYSKSKMACRHALADECECVSECVFYQKAPELLDKGVNWYEP